jgi:hypothetical protein
MTNRSEIEVCELEECVKAIEILLKNGYIIMEITPFKKSNYFTSLSYKIVYTRTEETLNSHIETEKNVNL